MATVRVSLLDGIPENEESLGGHFEGYKRSYANVKRDNDRGAKPLWRNVSSAVHRSANMTGIEHIIRHFKSANDIKEVNGVMHPLIENS